MSRPTDDGEGPLSAHDRQRLAELVEQARHQLRVQITAVASLADCPDPEDYAWEPEASAEGLARLVDQLVSRLGPPESELKPEVVQLSRTPCLLDENGHELFVDELDDCTLLASAAYALTAAAALGEVAATYAADALALLRLRNSGRVGDA